MTSVSCEKWQACGNDFILLQHDLSDAGAMSRLALSVCDRHEGVGADGIVAFDRPDRDVRCRIFNMGGSEDEISGNGVRCLAGYLRLALPAALADESGPPL